MCSVLDSILTRLLKDCHTEGVVDAASKPEERVVEGNLWEGSLSTSLQRNSKYSRRPGKLYKF